MICEHNAMATPEAHIDEGTRSPGGVLLIEPFYGGSHRQLIDLLHTHIPQCTLLTLPATKWHWRARTSALHFAYQIPREYHFRVLFASSVLNLAELVALRPELHHAKKILYFHENQLVYPVRKQQDRDFQYGYNQILSCLVADTIVFNSRYNQESFLTSVDIFLKLMPDRPRNLAATIRPKCQVIYFPIDFPLPPTLDTKPESQTTHDDYESNLEDIGKDESHLEEILDEHESNLEEKCEEKGHLEEKDESHLKVKDEDDGHWNDKDDDGSHWEEMDKDASTKGEKYENESNFEEKAEEKDNLEEKAKDTGHLLEKDEDDSNLKDKDEWTNEETLPNHSALNPMCDKAKHVTQLPRKRFERCADSNKEDISKGYSVEQSCIQKELCTSLLRESSVGYASAGSNSDDRMSQISSDKAMMATESCGELPGKSSDSFCTSRYHAIKAGVLRKERDGITIGAQNVDGVDLSPSACQPRRPLHILWPHRWEHDKNPEQFFAILFQLHEAGLDFILSVLGENYQEIPAIFSEARTRLQDHIVNWGYLPGKRDYYLVLSQADVVVSTAIHEFFGVAMLEAVHYGCYPLCPDRLVYPEIFAAEYLYRTPAQLSKKLRRFCCNPQLPRSHHFQGDLTKYSWVNLGERYRRLFLVD